MVTLYSELTFDEFCQVTRNKKTEAFTVKESEALNLKCDTSNSPSKLTLIYDSVYVIEHGDKTFELTKVENAYILTADRYLMYIEFEDLLTSLNDFLY